jgi:inner membrane protein
MGSHWYALDLTATDNLTLQPVAGQFPVVGIWQNGLIIEQDGQLRAVGASPASHNLYPRQARLIAGEPLRVVAERVDMAGHRLRWLVERIDQSRPYYLLGEVEIADGKGPALVGRLDNVDRYNPALYRGGILQLHYARAQELGPWLDLVAVRGEVVVQFLAQAGGGRSDAGGGGGNGRRSGSRRSCSASCPRVMALRRTI